MLLVALGLVTLAAVESITWTAIRELGVPVACLVLGAYGVHHFVVKEWKVLYQQERADKLQAQAERKEAFDLTTPALIQANANQAAYLDMLRRGGEK